MVIEVEFSSRVMMLCDRQSLQIDIITTMSTTNFYCYVVVCLVAMSSRNIQRDTIEESYVRDEFWSDVKMVVTKNWKLCMTSTFGFFVFCWQRHNLSAAVMISVLIVLIVANPRKCRK
jgi:hypothetical protein